MTAPCARCGGTGFEIVEREGREYAQPCACRRPAAGARSADSFLAECRIPARYEHCTLANFDPWSAAHKAALEKAMQYCNGYPFLGPSEGLGLLLTGSNGVGKTHLVVAVLRELVLTKGAGGQFWDFHELMREIKNSYDAETRTTEYQVLSPVIEMPVLLLDDLGAWRITDWMNDTLFFILNSRYLARRPTLITTNFFDASPQHAKEAGDSYKREFLVERIGDRLRSRLMEMCLHIAVHGEDFRERQQKANRATVMGTSELAPEPAPPGPRPRFGG
jgi:DNA replication protein DnaC